MRVALKRVENDSNEPGDIQRIFDDHIPMRILSFQVGVIFQYCFIDFKIWIDIAFVKRTNTLAFAVASAWT